MKKGFKIYLWLLLGSWLVASLTGLGDSVTGSNSSGDNAGSHSASAKTIRMTDGMVSVEELHEMFPETGDYNIVPPTQGSFLEAWSGMKSLEHLYYPVYGMLESMDKALEEKGLGQVLTSDVEESYLYVQSDMNGTGLEPYNAVYSDPRLINSGGMVKRQSPLNFLIWAIHSEFAVGIAFNPRSRVCDKDVFNYFINKHGVAEVIGYLQADASREGRRPFHELALEAAGRGADYEVLYYWGRSYREPRDGDDWVQCELAKLQAYWAADYPGSKGRAISELEWFIGEHGSTPERTAQLARWR